MGAAVTGGGAMVAAADVLNADVSTGEIGSVVDACVPAELEHAASNAGAASHSERALARLMIGNSTGSAANALVIE